MLFLLDTNAFSDLMREHPQLDAHCLRSEQYSSLGTVIFSKSIASLSMTGLSNWAREHLIPPTAMRKVKSGVYYGSSY